MVIKDNCFSKFASSDKHVLLVHYLTNQPALSFRFKYFFVKNINQLKFELALAEIRIEDLQPLVMTSIAEFTAKMNFPGPVGAKRRRMRSGGNVSIQSSSSPPSPVENISEEKTSQTSKCKGAKTIPIFLKSKSKRKFRQTFRLLFMERQLVCLSFLPVIFSVDQRRIR
jgi:hypothetical protein